MTNETRDEELNGHGWTVAAAMRFIFRVMDERDQRYEQRFQSSQKAVDEARQELQKKQETQNEWRGAMNDKDKLFATRAELTPINEQLRKCVTKPEVIAFVSIICLITSTLITILNFAMFQHK